MKWLKKQGTAMEEPRGETDAARRAAHARLRWHNGRPYVDGTSEALAKDAQGDAVLDFQHFVLRRQLGAIHQAPVERPARILDVGCGTGRWTAEIAAEFPGAEVVGLDLVVPRDAGPMLAALGPLAPHVSFVEADLLRGLPFSDASFDFTHLRLMYSELPAQSWPQVIRELARVTRPGGWVECMEPAAEPFDPTPAFGTIMAWSVELCRRKGLDANVGPRLTYLMAGVGLKRVTERIFTEGHGQTPRHERRMQIAQARAAIDFWREPVIAGGITTAAEYDGLAAVARRELDADQHANGDVLHIVFGQRV